MRPISLHRLNTAVVLSGMGMIFFLGAIIFSPTATYAQTVNCEQLSRIKSFNASFRITGAWPGGPFGLSPSDYLNWHSLLGSE